MSDNIPFEIQVEIMKRLPVKSLIQFRKVSKSWKSLIDTSHFIINHSSSYNQQHQHLLVTSRESDNVTNYVSFVDDNTFPQQSVPLIPPSLIISSSANMVGYSHGLFCFYGDIAVLWNPSIRKTVGVVVPHVADKLWGGTVLGFGVCRETSDPKILMISKISRETSVEHCCIAWHTEIFTLSTGVWRRLYNNLPRELIELGFSHEVIDGVLYWHATVNLINLIVSFDMTSEEFREINLPDTLTYMSIFEFSLSKLRESLVVLDHDTNAIWMMEDDGVSIWFTELFTVDVNAACTRVLGFRKSGEALIDVSEDCLWTHKLIAYEPYSKQVDDVGINVDNFTNYAYRVCPYIETLFLLDQPDLVGDDETETDSEDLEFYDISGILGIFEEAVI